MCSATDTFDIALVAQGVDIVDSVYDGDPPDPQAQEKLDSTTRLLQAEQTAAVGLREEMVSLQLQHEELQESLSQPREEVAADRQARLAAEERATRATEAQAALERQLVNRKDLEQKIQNQVASLSALCSRMGAE